VSDSSMISVEGSGETVGEAKWTALRELEARVPGLDRDSVEFQVVSEGERGLLGVGFTPARVVATVAAGDPGGPEDEEVQLARELVVRVAGAMEANVTVSTRQTDDSVTITCAGPDVALFIGRHGQTIDAVQYLANAIARTQGATREVVVDAAGYRARRAATLEKTARRAAERATATSRRVALDPMTPVERKIVHESLKDDPEVETASEGSEPNRYVVVLPRHAVG
jgi:spoIIIJ-associated protein